MDEPLELPQQTPLYHAHHSSRYDRQDLIKRYQDEFGCRMAVMVDWIFPASITLFEELIYDADPATELHVVLNTPGGDGEVAVRLLRAAHARCKRLVVIVPDFAKSAGTLLALGAHEIVMGPASDLGPIDPQLQMPDGTFAPAKSIIAAVDEASASVQDQPETYPIHAALLGQVTALTLQQARESLARTDDLLRLALMANADRSDDEVNHLFDALKPPLVDEARSHEALFGAGEAEGVGLPVATLDPDGHQWQMLWRLWTKYFALSSRVYEGERASVILPWPGQE